MTEPGTPPESYERYFVPAIGAPLAGVMVRDAALRPGDRVLDVACGTGVVARMAAEAIGGRGAIVGVDVNPSMLAVARAVASPRLAIEWCESSADAIALADGSFDVALCQLGLQFFPDRPAALHEIRRLLAPDGRFLVSVPGPTPPLFTILAEALAEHIGPGAKAFLDVVFALDEPDELRRLLVGAGFQDVHVHADVRTLRLPPAEAFLTHYLSSTPLAAAVHEVDPERQRALRAQVIDRWESFTADDALVLELPMIVGRATR